MTTFETLVLVLAYLFIGKQQFTYGIQKKMSAGLSVFTGVTWPIWFLWPLVLAFKR